VYWSTAIQYRARSSTIDFAWSGQAKRAKYQDESTNVSMVSVSRFAGLPQLGQVVFTKDGSLFADCPCHLATKSSGSLTGNWSSGTGTSPQDGQWMIGTGQPQ